LPAISYQLLTILASGKYSVCVPRRSSSGHKPHYSFVTPTWARLCPSSNLISRHLVVTVLFGFVLHSLARLIQHRLLHFFILVKERNYKKLPFAIIEKFLQHIAAHMEAKLRSIICVCLLLSTHALFSHFSSQIALLSPFPSASSIGAFSRS